MTTDSTELNRQGQRTSKHFLWIRSPEFNFLQFTWFIPGFSGFSTLSLRPILHKQEVTQKVLGKGQPGIKG